MPAKVIPPLKKGSLTKFGYSSKLSAEERHTALNKAVKEYGKGTVVKKVNAVAVLSKAKPSGKVFRADVNWLKK